MRAAVRSRARMDDHSRGLVDHGDIFVFVENIERNRFRFDAGRLRAAGISTETRVAWLHAIRRLHRDAVHLHESFFHQRLDARAAQFGKLRDQKAIEPFAGLSSAETMSSMCSESVVHKVTVVLSR